MDNIVETYYSVPIYTEGGLYPMYYILCRDDNGEENRIYSPYLPALKRKITQSVQHDNLTLEGKHVYVYF